MWLMIILKATKRQVFTLSLENTFFTNTELYLAKMWYLD